VTVGRAALAVVLAAFLLASAAGARGSAVPRSRLAIMVLPQSAYGPSAGGLDVHLGSGVQDNAAAADDTLDPTDSAARLGVAGRITGYKLGYDDLSMRSFVRGSGVVELTSSVDLFRSAGAADAYVARQLADARRLRGKYLGAGEALESSGTFAVSAIGDGAVGLHEHIRLGHGTLDTRLVAFRVGPLLATVAITRGDAKRTDQAAIALARLLETRVHAAEAGNLNANPVAVPQIGRPGVAPAGGPALGPMALTGADVAPGARVARQGYVADINTLATYERELEFDGKELGGSVLTSVGSDVSLLRSPTEARGQLSLFNSFFDSPALAAEVRASLPGATVVQTRRLPAADEAYVAVVRIPSNGRTVHVAQITVLVGPVIGVLTAAFAGPPPAQAAVDSLAKTFAARIAAGL